MSPTVHMPVQLFLAQTVVMIFQTCKTCQSKPDMLNTAHIAISLYIS